MKKCPNCGQDLKIEWEELFGRMWVCEKCNSWFSEAWDKQLESGVAMASPVIQPEGVKNAG